MKFFLKLFFIPVLFLCLTETATSQTSTLTTGSGSASSIKYEGSIAYTYTLSGLSTTAEADSLETIFKERPGIMEIMIDLPVHKITVYAPENMPEADLQEVIRFAGKKILVNPKELSKYYPN